jgi:hypothetical protein
MDTSRNMTGREPMSIWLTTAMGVLIAANSMELQVTPLFKIGDHISCCLINSILSIMLI